MGPSTGSTTSATPSPAAPAPTRSPASRRTGPATWPRPPWATSGSSATGSSASAATDLLLAFDGDSGLLDWSYSPPSGRINPKLHVGPSRIVLQVREPNSLLVLDTQTGRRRASFARVEDEDWLRDPLPVDDDHVAVVADRLTVALLSLDRGVPVWIFRETADLPKYGPPRLLGDGDRLFVLHDGRDLIRLDPATGAKVWSTTPGDREPQRAARGDRLRRRPGLRRRRRRPWPPSTSRTDRAPGSGLWTARGPVGWSP